MKKVLVIEEERELAGSVRDFLSAEGYAVELSFDFQAAVLRLEMDHYDYIIMDAAMKGGKGLSIARKIITRNLSSEIIIISDTCFDRGVVPGMDAGSCITRPFTMQELKRRMDALSGDSTGQKEISVNNIRVLPASFEAFVKDQRLNLTRMEFELLVFFLLNRNCVLTREMIAGHLWMDRVNTPSSLGSVYTHVKNLRQKLRECGSGDLIRVLYGLGYKFHA